MSRRRSSRARRLVSSTRPSSRANGWGCARPSDRLAQHLLDRLPGLVRVEAAGQDVVPDGLVLLELGRSLEVGVLAGALGVDYGAVGGVPRFEDGERAVGACVAGVEREKLDGDVGPLAPAKQLLELLAHDVSTNAAPERMLVQ